MTSRRQISLFGEDEWTFLQEDSHAKTQVRQNNSGKDSSGLGVSERDFGGIWRVRSTRSGHDGLSQRMLLTSQELTTEEILQRSSMSWPDWGMMRNGRLCTLQMRVRPIEERGCYMVAHTDGIRLHEGEPFFSNVCQEIIKERRMLSGTPISVGVTWAGQPPVCSLDYGFSRKSSELYGKSRLKEEVFHAYGNAIVPQVAFEIFKAIETSTFHHS